MRALPRICEATRRSEIDLNHPHPRKKGLAIDKGVNTRYTSLASQQNRANPNRRWASLRQRRLRDVRQSSMRRPCKIDSRKTQ